MSKEPEDKFVGLHDFLKPYGPFKKRKFTAQQKKLLRPIAEVLALLDGNAFFGMSVDDGGEDTWYEQYLPEAWAVYQGNGGGNGWASEVSWIKDSEHENESVRQAYEHWRLLKQLSRKR